jgi:hypothetical protein
MPRCPQIRGHTMLLSGIKVGMKAQQQIDKADKGKAHNIENKKKLIILKYSSISYCCPLFCGCVYAIGLIHFWIKILHVKRNYSKRIPEFAKWCNPARHLRL